MSHNTRDLLTHGEGRQQLWPRSEGPGPGPSEDLRVRPAEPPLPQWNSLNHVICDINLPPDKLHRNLKELKTTRLLARWCLVGQTLTPLTRGQLGQWGQSQTWGEITSTQGEETAVTLSTIHCCGAQISAEASMLTS